MKHNHNHNHFVNLHDNSIPQMRADFKNHHAKFMHSSWLVSDDIDRKVDLGGESYTIHGLWRVDTDRVWILLRPENAMQRGHGFTSGIVYRIAHSREVANALGYFRMRSLVTGKELPRDAKSLRPVN